MIGLFKAWKVTTIIEDTIKRNAIACIFGSYVTLSSNSELNDKLVLLLNKIDNDFIDISHYMIEMKKYHDEYLKGDKTKHNDTVIYLTLMALFITGHDKLSTDRKAIRHLSQGFYGALMNKHQSYIQTNVGLFNEIDEVVRTYLIGIR